MTRFRVRVIRLPETHIKCFRLAFNLNTEINFQTKTKSQGVTNIAKKRTTFRISIGHVKHIITVISHVDEQIKER